MDDTIERSHGAVERERDDVVDDVVMECDADRAALCTKYGLCIGVTVTVNVTAEGEVTDVLSGPETTEGVRGLQMSIAEMNLFCCEKQDEALAMSLCKSGRPQPRRRRAGGGK